MLTLKDRRKLLCSSFLFKILQGFIDCPSLLALLRINCPSYRTRHYTLLKTNNSDRDYIIYEPFNFIVSNFNKFYDCFNFNLSIPSFKKNIVNKIKLEYRNL